MNNNRIIYKIIFPERCKITKWYLSRNTANYVIRCMVNYEKL